MRGNMKVLEELKPKKVFQYFEEICQIPHGSGNLDRISSYLECFAKDRNLECYRDSSNNVIIIKEATKGYENVEPIILQGHMDMVAVKKDDSDINLETDALKLKVEGDYIFAEGTSLGGDDGIAVAYILAIMDSDDIDHPRIEAVITTDEEVGMEGASAIDLSMLKAKRMINIDSEEEGILLTSCAGGARVDSSIPVTFEKKSGTIVDIEIGGLIGGHSGTEINKERGNAIKFLGFVLREIANEYNIQIVDIVGGEKDNAIPRYAKTTIMINKDHAKSVLNLVNLIEVKLKNENKSKEKDLFIKAKIGEEKECNVLTDNSTLNIIDYLVLLPNGVVAMSADIAGLVETSLNVGILKLNNNEMIASSAIRSSIEISKEKLKMQLEVLAKRFEGTVQIHGDYPGWQFDPDSKLRALMVDIYEKMFKLEVKIEALHAGLECGIMISKIDGLDCVSYGPNIYDIHTTEERLSISSTERMWNYLLEILRYK